MKSFAIAITIGSFALPGCWRAAPSSPPSAAAVSPSPTISGLPVSLKVKQRSTTSVPGSVDELLLTADDITRGQVMVSLIRNGGNVVLGPISMENGDSATFHFGETAFSLKLAELDNDLVGDDFATFIVSAAVFESLTEKQKIERLIEVVESMGHWLSSSPAMAVA